ncbi:MAG: HNH endonuclease [Thermoplasmatales archaeon]|nr:HNH endonuclease [Thermoplasmatales archaeon]
MKGNIEERLERLNRKYSQYGEVYDYVSSGSIEETNISWDTAKIIALERDEYKCRICGKAPMISEDKEGVSRLRVEVEVHHIVPRIAGGSDSTKNLITLCKECHIKTFKNNYTGVPFIARRLDERVEVLTNITALLRYGSNCQNLPLISFYYRNREVSLKEPLNCKICDFPSLKRVYDIIFQYDLDIEEIVIKDKKGKFCVGIIEK